ncbi:hypothetical protein Dimus_020884 [Dionaea muscipula]
MEKLPHVCLATVLNIKRLPQRLLHSSFTSAAATMEVQSLVIQWPISAILDVHHSHLQRLRYLKTSFILKKLLNVCSIVINGAPRLLPHEIKKPSQLNYSNIYHETSAQLLRHVLSKTGLHVLNIRFRRESHNKMLKPVLHVCSVLHVTVYLFTVASC